MDLHRNELFDDETLEPLAPEQEPTEVDLNVVVNFFIMLYLSLGSNTGRYLDFSVDVLSDYCVGMRKIDVLSQAAYICKRAGIRDLNDPDLSVEGSARHAELLKVVEDYLSRVLAKCIEFRMVTKSLVRGYELYRPTAEAIYIYKSALGRSSQSN